MWRVLVSDTLSTKGLQVFEDAEGIQVDVRTGLDPAALREAIAPYDALVIRSATRVTAEVLEAAEHLKVVGRAGIGVDNVDVPAATKRGVVVMNTPGGNTVTTAEHAVALMMSLVRNVPQADASMKEGRWEKKAFQGRELSGKTLGVVGLGNIGSIVADRAQALKMKVIAYDPFLSPERAAELGAERVELDELYRRSDIVTVHVPLLDETRNLIDAGAFERMKPGAYLVCAARGGIVDEDALLDALESGRIAGAALDVYREEPPGASPLVAHPKVVCTPHLGASTVEAQEAVAVQVAEQVVEFLRGGTIRNAVNVPSLPAEALAALAPSLELARALGSLQAQLGADGLRAVDLRYAGRTAEGPTGLLTAAVLEGLLSPVLGERVNRVNAPLVAKERGIRVTETTSANGEDYAALVRLTVELAGRRASLAGALFAEGRARIVEIDGVGIEADPKGDLLVFWALDRPGLVGGIAGILADRGINIGQMKFGRESPGGRAVAVFNVDSAVDDRVLAELRGLPNLLSATRVCL
ncbi:MAG: phosphoglycerate dehydrogenase [Deferrisomatales bacterium]